MHASTSAVKPRTKPRPLARTGSRYAHYRKYMVLYLISLPGIFFFLVFKYVPLFGSIMAFKDYNVFAGMWKSEWVGFAHFKRMFEYPDFGRILMNTIAIGGYTLLFAFPIPIVLALLMNELRGRLFKRFVQTAVYLPHFLSWVVVAGIVIGILSPTNGLMNQLLNHFGVDSIYFMGEESYVRSIIVGSGVWRDAGWSTIIYLAAMAGINPDLYEAAQLDGANRWRQTRSITIPALLPTITVLFLLQIGQFLDLGFERVYVFLNPLNGGRGDILDTYIYDVGLIQGQYSYTTAIGLFKSLIGLALIMGANALSKKTTGEGLY